MDQIGDGPATHGAGTKSIWMRALSFWFEAHIPLICERVREDYVMNCVVPELGPEHSLANGSVGGREAAATVHAFTLSNDSTGNWPARVM